MKALKRAVRTLGVCYLLLVATLFMLQRKLIYLAEQTDEATQLARAQRIGVDPWRAAGEIVGWRRASTTTPAAANRLVVFHGNAGSALYRTHFIEGFEGLDGGALWQVHLFEYPGYGARGGEPSEETITKAARAAVHELAREDSRPIFVLGESLGSGPACALARDESEHVSGVFLVTPFARLGDVAAHHYPMLMVNLILRDRWDNVSALHGYRGPVAVLLAGRDEVIPAAQGEELFRAYAGPKRRWDQPRATHNTIDFSGSAPWWREVSDFLLQKPL